MQEHKRHKHYCVPKFEQMCVATFVDFIQLLILLSDSLFIQKTKPKAKLFLVLHTDKAEPLTNYI